MNNLISPIVKHVWNVAMQTVHNHFGFVIKKTAYHLDRYEP